MFESDYHSMAELKARVEEDKQSTGLGAATRNRYPIRFVLFDNFRDCYEFVDYLQSERDAQVESVDKWIDPSYPDLIISHVELAEKIQEFIRKISPCDCVIAPFSELARFYDNEHKKSFDALLKTVKGIEASAAAVEKHQRIYIPVVGLQGKMEVFKNDTQITIWRLASEEKDLTYRLILTSNKVFGVKGLESHFTIVNTIREWLNIWKDTKFQVTPNIICKSSAIFANAEYAQPDNAFTYFKCNDAYQFLVNGLQLSFGDMQPLISDADNWDTLAEAIDLSEGFDFRKFVRNHFGVNDIDDHKDFIRLWFMHVGSFDRWLLARFYMNQKHEQGYMCRQLKSTTCYGNNELIEKMVADINGDSEDMAVRKYCLCYAAKMGVCLSDAAEGMVAKLFNTKPQEIGYAGTLTYFTGISRKEKEFAVSWLGQGKIQAEDIKDFYPDLYHYMKNGVGIPKVPDWLEQYIKEYKRAKTANTYTPEIKELINKQNASESAFDIWYNKFSTTYTLLQKRGDIEVFYWIDGLGVDWIPLIREIIAEKKEQMIFLNEVMVARALLPTKTDVNKQDLQRLLPEGAQLEKAGDLDALAHKNNNISPFTLNTEIELVRKTIEEILNKYIGKKIAIVSDHGISYLPQLLDGLNMGGVESDHHGRVAIRKKADSTIDSNYFRLGDNKTLCALKHESLCAKVPSSQGIHGGCTPEEVLVPIFIISSAAVACNWTASILDMSLSGADPYLHFTIKNLPSLDIPYINYDGKRYELHLVGPETYKSDPLQVDSACDSVTLVVGDVERVFPIAVSTGVEMDDLFS